MKPFIDPGLQRHCKIYNSGNKHTREMVKLATFDSNWELMCGTDPSTITPDNSERRIKSARHFAGSGSALRISHALTPTAHLMRV